MDKDYVRIKLNHSKKNKDKGFYLLMTNCNMYSDADDEFIIERQFLKLLKKNKITYDVLSLSKRIKSLMICYP